MDWSNCPLVNTDPDVVHGEPVFAGTRVPAESVIESVEAYLEEGLSLEGAIEATVISFPSVPEGSEGVRKLLAYYSSQTLQPAA